jgi:hypothetical protein
MYPMDRRMLIPYPHRGINVVQSHIQC